MHKWPPLFQYSAHKTKSNKTTKQQQQPPKNEKLGKCPEGGSGAEGKSRTGGDAGVSVTPTKGINVWSSQRINQEKGEVHRHV